MPEVAPLGDAHAFGPACSCFSARVPAEGLATRNSRSSARVPTKLRHLIHNKLGKLLPATYTKLNASCMHCFWQSSTQITSEMCFPPSEDSGYIGYFDTATVSEDVMPASDYAPAIRHWWAHVEKNGGLASYEQSATVSTMLFGCNRWLELNAGKSSAQDISEIERIRDELCNWIKLRGKTYRG